MYAVMNVKKVKLTDISKVAKEQGRTVEDYLHGAKYANDIDWTRTSENVVFVPTEGAKSRINGLIKEAGARTRPDSVGALGVVITATDAFFSKKEDLGWQYDDKTADYFQSAKDWIVDNLCGGNPSLLVSCVVHMDEKTPHLQALVCPLTENERGETVLSAKRLLNGRQKMRELQNSFHERVGKPRGLERGELVDLDKPPKRKRKEPQEWREDQLREAQAKVVEAAEFIQNGSPPALDNVKDAAFGRGKIIPNDDFEQIVKWLQRFEGLKKALEGLESLAQQADKNGRVLTAEGLLRVANERIEIGNEKAQEWGKEIKAARELVKSLERIPVRAGLSMRKVWENTLQFYTMSDGSIAYDRLAAGYIDNVKRERKTVPRVHSHQQEQEHNGHDDFDFGNIEMH